MGIPFCIWKVRNRGAVRSDKSGEVTSAEAFVGDRTSTHDHPRGLPNYSHANHSR